VKLRARACWIALFALLPPASGALPWNKDMVDQPSIKAQEKRAFEKNTDEAYKSTINRIPDAQQKVDPWGNMRTAPQK